MAAAARIFTPPNRLAKVLIDNGGRTAAEAIGGAEVRLDALGDHLERTVDGQVARILFLHRQGEAVVMSRHAELGAAAMSIAEIAGAAKRPQVGEAARGICAMIESLTACNLWHWDALDLHVSALVLLSGHPTPTPGEAMVMLTRLRQMRATIGVPD